MKIGQRVKTEHGEGEIVGINNYRGTVSVGIRLDIKPPLYESNVLYYFKNEIEPVNSLDCSQEADHNQ